MPISQILMKLARTKTITRSTQLLETQLNRCLTTTDITLLAIGHMIGSGVYVLTSSIARQVAGPAIILSFIFSAFVSFLAAISYAEMAVRYPKSGSAYSYTYLAIGEGWAFFVGWSVILENIIGLAAVARACSAYINSLCGGYIRNTTLSVLNITEVSNYSHIDVLSVVIIIAVLILLSTGVRFTSYLNNVFTTINIGVISVIIGAGLFYIQFSNWTNPDIGGFMPYGWRGVIEGSASCFYAYIGFDAIATSGEEAINPSRSIPLATFISMAISTIAYVGVSAVLTLMIPYNEIALESGLPDAFGYYKVYWVKIIVIVGALCGMATALIGTMFALTRVVYAMAQDGLIYSIFSRVNDTTQLPLIAMYSFAFISALLALSLDLASLVQVMSIGTLLAYLIVSAGVIILRYRPMPFELVPSASTDSEFQHMSESEFQDNSGKLKEKYYVLSSWSLFKFEPGQIVTSCVFFLAILFFLLSGTLNIFFETDSSQKAGPIAFLVLTLILIVIVFMIIYLHEPCHTPLPFKVPCVPLIPSLSILCNAILMTNLNAITWFRLTVWVIIGMLIYATYGIKNSRLNEPNLETVLLESSTSPDRRLRFSNCLLDDSVRISAQNSSTNQDTLQTTVVPRTSSPVLYQSS